MSSFEIPIFDKKKKPILKDSVSNIFTIAQKNVDETEEQKQESGKEQAKKIIKSKKKELDPKIPPPPSPFLQLLQDHLNNLPKKKPVPTPSANQVHGPVNGFGEKMLKKQGYEESKPFKM